MEEQDRIKTLQRARALVLAGLLKPSVTLPGGMEVPGMGALETKLYLLMVLESDYQTGVVRISSDYAARLLGTEPKRARKARHRLVLLGAIEAIDAGGGYQGVGVYQLLVPAAADTDLRAGVQKAPALPAPAPAESPGSASPPTGAPGAESPGSASPNAGAPRTPRPVSPAQPTHSGASGGADSPSAEAFLLARGIFANQAKRFAKAYPLAQLMTHWRAVVGAPRVRDRSAAFAARLRDNLPPAQEK